MTGQQSLGVIFLTVGLTSLLTFALWDLFALQRESVDNWQAYSSCSSTLNYVEGHVLTTKQKWRVANFLGKKQEASRAGK